MARPPITASVEIARIGQLHWTFAFAEKRTATHHHRQARGVHPAELHVVVCQKKVQVDSMIGCQDWARFGNVRSGAGRISMSRSFGLRRIRNNVGTARPDRTHSE